MTIRDRVFIIVEDKRGLKKKRQYKIYTPDNPEVPMLRVEENVGAMRQIFRMVSGDGLSAMKMDIFSSHDEKLFQIKKKIGTADTSAFRLYKDDKMLGRCFNKIRFNDDSFMEIYAEDKSVLFKSGLSSRSTWYPISIFKAEDAESTIGSISGKTHAVIERTKSAGLFRGSSGNEFKLSFTETPSNVEELAQMVNFAVAADYAYDTK